MHILRPAIAAFSLMIVGSAAAAQDCTVSVADPFDLEPPEIATIYDCLKDAMVAGYTKQGNKVGENYRNWTVSSTAPAVAGPHGSRLLQTFANEVAAEQYLKFAEEGVVMPVGSVLAKESIAINKKKKIAKVGPLFIMTKVEAGTLPDTNDWRYDGLQPNGKEMKFKQSFCHDCHAAFEDQDYLAYPLEEVRVSN